MRFLILGGTGMFGFQMVKECMDRNLDFYATLRNPDKMPDEFKKKLADKLYILEDAADWDALEECVSKVKPDYLINCVGIVKQSPLAKKPIESITINSLLPHKLESFGQKYNFRLIHISTDCVFSGNKGSYVETDFSDADDLYGRSKYLGEVDYGQGVTIRTSVIGNEIAEPTHGLLEWFLSQKGPVNGYKNVIFSGLTTTELAKVMLDEVVAKEIPSGLYHVASDPISKYKLLHIINDIYRKNTDIQASDELSVDRSLRPSKFNEITNYSCPSWSQLIEEMKDQFEKFDAQKQ